MITIRTLLFSTMALAGAGMLQAQVLYTNLGPGFAHGTSGYVIGSSVNQVVGAQFTPSSSAPFGDAILGLTHNSGTNQYFIYLMTDSAGAPGAVLEKITVSGLPSFFTATTTTVITAKSVLHPVLTAGTKYWLVVTSLSTSHGDWFLASTDTSDGTNLVFNLNGDPPTPAWIFSATGDARPAFQIDGAFPFTDEYQVGYVANLLSGDSYVNITNAGSRGGYDVSQTGFSPAGGICANVYVFDPSEEMVACCSCYVSPDGLRSLSAQNDLVVKTLTPAKPNGIVIKLVASVPIGGSTCDPTDPYSANLESGMRAWGTSLHANTTTSQTNVTENAFRSAKLSESELQKLTTFCAFIKATGSTFGICNACRVGGTLGGDIR